MNHSESNENDAPGLNYRDAGVDLDKYRQAMARLPQLMKRTFTPRVIPLEGGFAGLFRLDNRRRLFSRGYRDPVLVAGTDGVGTKLKVAQLAGRHETIGIDLVAMCVNDILCCGAEPLFFLDYVSMAQDDPPLLTEIVRGISDGCRQSEMALLGGETAIMPDLYQPGDYDLAGFAVGVVERKCLIDGSRIAGGDTVIGLHSSGIHANGFSLVRKIVFERAGLAHDAVVEPLGESVADALLAPTMIYAAGIRRVIDYYRVKHVVHGLAHITGGGLSENLERILPSGVDVVLDPQRWPVPRVFPWLAQLGNVEENEMRRVFNMGIGMVLIASPFYADNIARLLTDAGYANTPIGRVTSGSGRVRWSPDSAGMPSKGDDG